MAAAVAWRHPRLRAGVELNRLWSDGTEKPPRRTASPVIYVVELLRVRPYYPHMPLQGSGVPKKSAETPSKCPTKSPCGDVLPDAEPFDAPSIEIWPP